MLSARCASAHDRRHECAQALCGHAERPYQQLQAVRGVCEAVPRQTTLEDIRRFQLHLAETGVSICNRNRIMTGLRFLFRVTLRRLDLAAEIYHIRESQKIPLENEAAVRDRRAGSIGRWPQD
jgi:integrase/recombinase XerD